MSTRVLPSRIKANSAFEQTEQRECGEQFRKISVKQELAPTRSPTRRTPLRARPCERLSGSILRRGEHRSGSAADPTLSSAKPGLRFDKRQEIRIDRFGLGGGHPVWKSLVSL